MASVAIGLTLAVHGGVHAYHQHVENQRVAEAVKEEQAANQRRQKFLDQIPKYDELFRDELIYNEADRVLGRDDIDIADLHEPDASSRVGLHSPKEFEKCFHVTPEAYQKQCLEKYGINADDFADDTEAEAQQRFDEAKREQDKYSSWDFWEQWKESAPKRIRALQSGDISYFKKSKESKVKQALEDKIDELEGAEYEAKRRERNDADPDYDSSHPEDVKVTGAP